jgi:hypothetical protein
MLCVRRAEVQNSTAVLRVNFNNKLGICASISRPNAQNVGDNFIEAYPDTIGNNSEN